MFGRAKAQAVSRRLPTAAARIRARVKFCGICGGQSGTRAGFLHVLRFPSAKHSIDCSTLIIRGWYTRPVVASVIVDSVPLQPRKGRKNKAVMRLEGLGNNKN
jgi:hypothetical protein